MKCLLIFLNLLILCSCTGTKYFITPDTLIPHPTSEYFIDSSCELYVRQVYRHFNTNENIWELVNEKVTESDAVVEKEFLILSKSLNNVLVINNVPSSYQKLYEKNQSLLVEGKSLNSTIEVNARYFRQFRFGMILDNSAIDFIPTEDDKITHRWNIEANRDSIVLRSISVGDASETRVRFIQPAIKIDIIYRRVPKFLLVFNRENNKGKVVETIPLVDNKIFVTKKLSNWYVVMKFTKPVDGVSVHNICFKNRVYAHNP